jgi:hypothetical protein
MASSENVHSSVPMPALLIERAIALGRAEAGLALMHTRRIAVRAVSALLGTIVGCAFAQLTLLLLVAWPVLAARVPLANLIIGVAASAILAASGLAFAISSWKGVGRERKAGPVPRDAASVRPAAGAPLIQRSPSEPATAEYDKRDQHRSVHLAERVTP